MRTADAITVEADDPIAARELEALTQQQGWSFTVAGVHRFILERNL